MKALLAICMIVASTSVLAATPAAPAPTSAPPAAPVVKGTVLDIKEVESYTYLLLKTKEGEIWAAVGKAPVKKGAEVTIENTMIMNNFESKSLKKTFPKIIFGSLAGAAPSAPAAGYGMNAPQPQAADVKVPKASGANAHTVAEIMAKPAALKDKQVLVRGKVVKYNGGIMGKNWVHLRDGSGSAADGTNDIIVTTMNQAKVGDIVTAKGVIRTDKDFGAGYSYKALVEEATLQP